MKFGTDGVRGRAYDELTLPDVARLGRAAGRVFGGSVLLVARDTRASGPDFVAALARGLAMEGVLTWDLGVAPTPAAAFLAGRLGYPAAVISASHNPWFDNGVKFFGAGGRKLDDATQAALEHAIADLDTHAGADPVAAMGRGPHESGTVVAAREHLGSYTEFLTSSLGGRRLDGLRVVVDAANGAASSLAGPVLRGLGAAVTVIANEPDGRNINEGAGSTDTTALAAAVVARGADAGLALDGDADRVLFVDAAGNLVDGDQIIAIAARDRQARGLLVDHTVVVTVMTNLGFHQAMDAAGITVHETGVGDRNVLAALDANGWTLGGEQSGHVIFADQATTGDGLLTGLALLDVMARTGESLAELAAVMTRLPQVLRNVRLTGPPAQAAAALAAAGSTIAAVEARLGGRGRVLVRASGTEPLIRVMAEAPTEDEADEVVRLVVEALSPPAGAGFLDS